MRGPEPPALGLAILRGGFWQHGDELRAAALICSQSPGHAGVGLEKAALQLRSPAGLCPNSFNNLFSPATG